MVTPVRYGQAEAEKLLLEALDAITMNKNMAHPGMQAHSMTLQLNALLGVVKHPGFQEEREWRIIVATERYQRDEVKFRSSPISIVPYIEIPFEMSAISAIRVGPGRYVELRRQGVLRLLSALGREADVLTSDIPLRT